MEGVDITGTDTGFGAMSQALLTRTFDEFVSHFYENQLAAVGGRVCRRGPIKMGGHPDRRADWQG
jgi:hypothetical protein